MQNENVEYSPIIKEILPQIKPESILHTTGKLISHDSSAGYITISNIGARAMTTTILKIFNQAIGKFVSPTRESKCIPW